MSEASSFMNGITPLLWPYGYLFANGTRTEKKMNLGGPLVEFIEICLGEQNDRVRFEIEIYKLNIPQGKYVLLFYEVGSMMASFVTRVQFHPCSGKFTFHEVTGLPTEWTYETTQILQLVHPLIWRYLCKSRCMSILDEVDKRDYTYFYIEEREAQRIVELGKVSIKETVRRIRNLSHYVLH